MNSTGVTGLTAKKKTLSMRGFGPCNSAYAVNLTLRDIPTYIHLLEKWFPLRGERAHSLKLYCMYDKRFEI